MDSRDLANKLIEHSVISDELAQKVITEANNTGKSFEEILRTRKLVDDLSIAKAKSEFLKIPYKEIDPSSITDEALKKIPEDTAKNYKIAPLEVVGDMVVVGMVNPDDTQAQEALKFIAKQNKVSLGVYVITLGAWEMVLRRYSPYEREIQEAVRTVGTKKGMSTTSQRVVSLDEENAGMDEAPIIKIVSSTLKAAVDQKASDIHIEPGRSKLRVRFRVDGSLKEVSAFPLELLQSIISRIKVLSDLKIDETRVPQDGRFRTVIFGRDVDYRVSTFPTPLGEKVVIRVLDPSMGLKDMESLGLVGRNADWVKEGLDKPYGMVLVTGPTGSGKTTTLYAFLQRLNKEDVNILSMEDPVEYFVAGVNQSQIKPEIGYTFASGLRQALRQDPDIIMVGEIRDNETANLAVQAALTGHVVLSTLHTNDAAGVIPRLMDMGVAPFLLPSSLNIMLAQRLVRRLCNDCKKEEEASPEIQKIIEEELGKLAPEVKETIKFKPPYKVYRAPGCDKCKGKGTSGRIAIYEVMKMTRELENIITSGANEGDVRDEGKRQGMVSLRQDGIIKALEGTVSIEEILRETTET
ncbi:MAG: ATPase, T2SS/T4P/T4SS family [Candidatus Colwellbacteria bacterium]|jgi:type IV pilus assembly protein PilB|nr:Flp pilus assembly complex ATPase component TadA [Candidatus Colwellbacteria bacterium]MCK9497577.1 Flp pilus assembly complex ATPase component TadA [Candidatus Colwellbacteria bacterium]MDD4818883.1 ATPase, T2SS/T4P/T4SS family [Candidatus Colwellbacteria bacterium]